MKKILLLCAACLAIVGCVHAGGGSVEQSSVKTFKEMATVAETMGAGDLSNTLIVMDDDDTLTMMPCRGSGRPKDCQYLGGPAWYDWQSALLKNDIKTYRVADSEEQLLEIAALLLAVNNMPYTENDIPTVLTGLTQKGAKLLVLTARGTSNVSATESQFTALKTDKTRKQSFLDFIKANALTAQESGMPSLAGPFTPKGCGATRGVVYQQGVMYVAGQNKGQMLLCLLAKTESQGIKNIVFLDDTLGNVTDVYQAFQKAPGYSVRALHYTLLSAHKDAFFDKADPAKTNRLQHYANRQWHWLSHSLRRVLQKPTAITQP